MQARLCVRPKASLGDKTLLLALAPPPILPEVSTGDRLYSKGVYTFPQAKEDTALICEQMRVLDRVRLTACLSDVLRGGGRPR